MNAAEVLAPAKLNLDLRVGPPTPDGFHPIRSWFRTIALHDALRLEAAAEAADLTCHVGNDPSIPSDHRNLCLRAARAWAAATGRQLDLTITLRKHIPAGGGLGGGSSDAAAVLRVLNDRHGRPLDDARLLAVAAELGSDVPFFLAGAADATCTGRGEVIAPFAAANRHAALVILTGIAVPTPAVFRRFDALPPPPDAGEPDYAAWSALPAADLLPLLRNDLEPAAFALHPRLRDARDACESRLDRRVLMTGSGGTLFSLYDDPAAAARAAASLDARAVVA